MISYEWVLETLEGEDIVNRNESELLSDLGYLSIKPDQQIVLTRSEGSQDEGITCVYWALVKDGALPECFCDAYGEILNMKVPKRFHAELSRFQPNHKQG